MSKLPSRDNISIPAGETFFQPKGAPRAYSLGHIVSFGWTPSVEVEPVYSSITGKRTKIDEIEKDVNVSVSLTLQEMRPDIMGMAMAGKVSNLTQAAASAEVLSVSGVKEGEVIDLGYLDVTSVAVVIDGGMEPAVEGTDYTVLAGAGHVVARADGDYEITFDAPEITATDARAVIEVLNKTGLEGTFTVIGKNEHGKRYMLRNFVATLQPSSEIPLHSDGSSVLNVELSGSGVYNDAMPNTPWGELVELA